MSYVKEYPLSLECIDREELLERMQKRKNFVIVDTVGKYGGNRYKIKGAKTIPYPDVVDRRKELMGYDEIIVYCKHRECKASKKVALALTLLNIPNVKVYEGGIDEWMQHNLPVEEE
jgi:rhodanese-related sulfurtransferase